MKQKKAQQVFGMSFSVIFSIILIIFFLVIAFIAIKAFLDVKKCSQVKMFINDLNSEVEDIWNVESNFGEFSRNLPSGITHVCFANLTQSKSGKYGYIYDEIVMYEGEDVNMFFYPLEKACEMSKNKIKYLDMMEITRLENPCCIKVNNGKITLHLEKDHDKRFVNIKCD